MSLRSVLMTCLLVGLGMFGPRMMLGAGGQQTCARSGESCFAAGYEGLTPLQREGRDTWYTWTGGDTDGQGAVVGDQMLWRILAVRSHGVVDLLQAVDSRYRGERFKRFGVMNDPDCKPASAPDKYGLWMDVCAGGAEGGSVGRSAGVVGLRRFDNPRFDAKRWDLQRYLKDPALVEPPYLIGVACGFCHVGPNPLHPPKDPEHPEWRNLHPAIGNQYFREQVFNTAKYPEERGLQPKDFRWQAAHAEPAGTSDTSQVATDHIADPSTINQIVLLNARPMHDVVTADGVHRRVYNVLKDGADSVGAACLDDPTERPGVNDTACAAMRGYLNIGVCADVWTKLVDPVYGLTRVQSPFDVKRARQQSRPCDESWTATVARLEGLEAFLRTFEPMRLADAEGGADFLPKDPSVVRRGKVVFAENCARCHSSKRPPANFQGTETDWFRAAVMDDAFLQQNFLSDDERYPVTEIGTNAERALATNAKRGQIWEEFSSETYKSSAAVHMDGLRRDATGGTGYYRTPSLANVWATAPYLHNNSVGEFNDDPSVAGRMAAYESGMEMLLWPERRRGKPSVHRTTVRSELTLDNGSKVCVARNTPVDLIANLDAGPGRQLGRNKTLGGVLCWVMGAGVVNRILERKDNAPDFVQDRGHTFGATLPDEDKRALMEYMKTF